MATISSETFAKRRAIFLFVRKTVNIQGYSELREPIKTREYCAVRRSNQQSYEATDVGSWLFEF